LDQERPFARLFNASEATETAADVDLCQKGWKSAVLGCRSWQNMVWEVLMLGFSSRTRFWTAIVVAVIMLTGTLSLAYAATGTVRLHIVKAGFIVGIGGGSGTLNFKGRNYPLSIGGINVGTIGASAVDLAGTVTNLRTAADIVGTYTQGSAALAIVGGGRVATLRNANGVVIRVRGPAIGLEASLSLSGMTISMQ